MGSQLGNEKASLGGGKKKTGGGVLEGGYLFIIRGRREQERESGGKDFCT